MVAGVASLGMAHLAFYENAYVIPNPDDEVRDHRGTASRFCLRSQSATSFSSKMNSPQGNA